MWNMFVLLGCEESQAVCIEFRKLGHQAYSCDLQECSGGHPEWHFNTDIFEVIRGGQLTTQSGETVYIEKWDMGIFFPTCTYLTISANKWYKDQPERKSGTLVGEARRKARKEAIQFFMDIVNCGIEKIAIENPIGVMSTEYRHPDVVLQPWMFGHGETKATCLWLKNLPALRPTNIVSGREQRIHFISPKKEKGERAKLRSKTFTGIAKAMAVQWSRKQPFQTILF
jgi:hypothetical protein